MATQFETNNLIREIAKAEWDKLVAENPFAFRSSGNDELVLPHGWEDFTFDDFCEEIRLELI